MAGTWKKDTKTMKLNTAIEIATWRQTLQKEAKFQKAKVAKELADMQGDLYRKNTYMHIFKNEDKLKKETIAAKTGKNIIFVYD
jgi:hypothetical protein